MKDCVHVDLDVPLGHLKEGIVDGRFNYSSNISFNPEFVDLVRSAEGEEAGLKLKVLKDTFSQLEKVSISAAILNRRKTKALEEEERDKLCQKKFKQNPKIIAPSTTQTGFHRRTKTSNFFELTSSNFIDNTQNVRRLKSFEAKSNFLRRTLNTHVSK